MKFQSIKNGHPSKRPWIFKANFITLKIYGGAIFILSKIRFRLIALNKPINQIYYIYATQNHLVWELKNI